MPESESNTRGTDWSTPEVARCVEVYFTHLALDISGARFNKEALYRSLSHEIGRSTSSVSMKFQNISAVLDVVGHEYIRGLSPLRNYQELLSESVGQHLENFNSQSAKAVISTMPEGLAENQSFWLGPPPVVTENFETLPSFMQSFAKKFDPIGRDAANRALGEAGENFIFENEKRTLISEGCKDLVKEVRWVSKFDGDGAGYDILSFQKNGDPKFIEVKTTFGSSQTPFFISRNELAFSKERAKNYRLVRLYDFRRSRSGFELLGNVENHVKLTAESYRAALNLTADEGAVL
jgi:Domain of unknown function (DUF3883)